MEVNWMAHNQLLSSAASQVKQVKVVLDIGCGIIPQNLVKPSVHICLEPFHQYIQVLQNKTDNASDRVYIMINATWAEAIKIFPERSVDTVFLLDVIEHLEKEEAKLLLKATEKIAKEQIVIFTPLGFLPQKHPDGKDAWGFDGGQWQEHKSGWQPEDFDDSYIIYACAAVHIVDSMGRAFDKPFGAFWAIKNIRNET
jgi:hypothetical protein